MSGYHRHLDLARHHKTLSHCHRLTEGPVSAGCSKMSSISDKAYIDRAQNLPQWAENPCSVLVCLQNSVNPSGAPAGEGPLYLHC